MIKKSLLLICITSLILATIVTAQKIEISVKESFSAGEKISFKVSLLDKQNNPINADVNVVIEDAEKRTKIEQVVQSNKLADVDLGEGARHGYWKIIAQYEDIETTAIFSVEMNEEAKFEIQGDKLTVTNIGNTRYAKTIDIIIGNSLGTKKVDLDLGESITFRLIAPDGTYNIRVTDGKTTITRDNLALTGKVVGILDERLTTGSSPVTGGLRPEDETSEEFYSLRNKKYIYVFLLVIIGAGILLAIERRYRKRV